jgi:hypothetical protein
MHGRTQAAHAARFLYDSTAPIDSRTLRDDMSSPSRPTFRSALPYDAARIHAAAVYCSDGRIGEHFDDFLQSGLGLPRYDRVALPGGPACLAGYDEAKVEQVGIVDELKFLIDAHGLTRVVLIQHEHCAFYTTRLRVAQKQLEHLQRADLVRAAYFIRHVTALSNVDAYFARRNDKAIEFEPVSIE